MKTVYIFLFFVFSSTYAIAQTNEDVSLLQKEVTNLRQQVLSQKAFGSNQQKRINSLQSELEKSKLILDSLRLV